MGAIILADAATLEAERAVCSRMLILQAKNSLPFSLTLTIRLLKISVINYLFNIFKKTLNKNTTSYVLTVFFTLKPKN